MPPHPSGAPLPPPSASTALAFSDAWWDQYSRLTEEAMALPPAGRAAWLDDLSPQLAPLRDALADFLRQLDAVQSAGYLETPAVLSGSAEPAAPSRQAGQRIGPYTLLRPLGTGGMGEVWLAQRADGAYQREVALKLPHAHLLVGRVRERFLRERDILARLTHPHIARFYDAGLDDDGQPYIALEAVHGTPITQWAREHGLDLAARLDLFMQVADAVAHAHSRLVAHRDLKPANVLVSAQGVRLLDFGIAKLLADGTADNTALTRADARPATPAYAAPEQLTGSAVTVATDVYALGVLLFELLCGRTPQAVLTARAASGLAAADLLASACATDDLAREAGRTPGVWRRQLRGDLDAIVAKALQPTPEARYASVADLAADLRRHRTSEPIQARRITRWTRFAKAVRRHRGAALMAGLLAVSLLAGLGGVLWQAREAQAQARRAEAVKAFLLSVYRANDPRIASDTPRGQISAKALLDASVRRIDDAFGNDVELRIELLRTAATIYRELGDEASFESLQARQLALVREHFGPLHDNILDDAVERAARAAARADPGCTELLQQADTALRDAGRDVHPLRAHWWMAQSVCLRQQSGTQPQRQQALEQAHRLFEQAPAAERGRVTVLMELASEATYAGRYTDAIALNQRALDAAQANPERDDAEVQTIHANMALTLQQSGDLAGAEAAFGRAAAIAERTTGPEARTAWLPAARRARTAHLAGARERAMGLFEGVLTRLPPETAADPEAQQVREDWGERLAAEGRPELAIPVLERIARAYLRAPPNDFALRRVRRHLGDAYARVGRVDDARRTFLAAVADFEAHDPAGSQQPTAAARERWGRFLLAQGDVAGAQVQFRAVVERAGNPRWSHTALAHAGLARVALAAGRTADAAAHADKAWATWDQKQGFFDIRMEPYLQRVRAAVLAAQGQAANAQALRDEALAASRRYDAPDAPSARQPLHLDL
ncbi:serine/threonine-protein kinase [Roseateles asaccharophilus]|uniref:Serine/threonine-protein kinase n=1 Tax=Roseateles asaccharophilus TaxID=582607 RepID=A0ABU2AD82_9BURK|nr:serine/threonine-protein kinase [Roseateles asaccharophilus]MDR7334940.1 serine/threonine-protein kinase [Roseateles asaccharophilus]